MLAIADEVEYSKGETHVHTTGAEALGPAAACARTMRISSAPRRGVLGVPARYVSGYLGPSEAQRREPCLGRGPC